LVPIANLDNQVPQDDLMTMSFFREIGCFPMV